MGEVCYHTFEELETLLGKNWVKSESWASGTSAIFMRTWPCGCCWTRSDMTMHGKYSDVLAPCAEHRELGFSAEFVDISNQAAWAITWKAQRRKGKLVNDWESLLPGQIIRVSTQDNSRNELWVIHDKVNDSNKTIELTPTWTGRFRSIKTVKIDELDNFKCHLITKDGESYPFEPIWKMDKLSP